ncbi:MAG: glycosyltransferase family 2 protein [Anaerolineae bacterium]|nr:glycosyltransferase family 2 protein [Anaerolineae bacterium]
MTPDLSIILVNYNTREPLRRCLESIRQYSGDLAVEIVVVDNGSRDGSPAMVREVMPDAVLIEPGYNSWFTGGNNIGVKASSGQYILILNPDTEMLPGTLPTLVSYMRDHVHVGGVSPRQRFPGGKEIAICSMTPRYPDLLFGYTFLGVILAPLRERRHREMFYADWDRTTSRAVEVVPDSSLLMTRELYDRLGGLDEDFKLYFTEDDICRRIINAGREVHLCADALLVHEENASVSQVQRLASQAYFDDLIVFCRKYYGSLAAAALRVLVAPTRWGMDLAQRLRGERKSL